MIQMTLTILKYALIAQKANTKPASMNVRIEPNTQGREDSKRLKKLLNPSDFAEIVGVRPETIYSWISCGVEIPFRA
jgi:hypothetical protein